MPNNRPNNQKKPNTVTPIQQRYQQQINTRKKLSKKYLFPYSNNKGYELPQNSKLALAFKRSNPLFVVNSLIGKKYFMQTFSKMIASKLLQHLSPIKIRSAT
jgi:hypothetical protein